MSNTIDLLNTIGADASLRHASAEDLERALTRMHASDGLKLAARSGDKDPLFQEFGANVNVAIQVNNQPHDGTCGEGDEDGAFEDVPSRDDDDQKEDKR